MRLSEQASDDKFLFETSRLVILLLLQSNVVIPVKLERFSVSNWLFEQSRVLRMELLLVGSFEDRQNPVSADSRAFLLSSPAVTYVGQQEDVRPFLKAADALVLPSYREGFPNVVLQGGAMLPQ